MNGLKKFLFIFLLAVGGAFFASPPAQAATVPYEYTFAKDYGNTAFNNIECINQLEITFDNGISVNKDVNRDGNKDEKDLFDPDRLNNPVYVVEKNGTDPINIISRVTISGNTLIVRFKNLDYIDYSDPTRLEYQLVIDKETVQFDQLSDDIIPFNIYDILPGFKSTFIDTDSSTINENIFKTNAPRDVYIHVPKIFITGIATIHRYDGITSDWVAPALTNIDVTADPEATRLKATFKGRDEYSRDLTRRTDDVDGFTMGQAGINEITDHRSQTINEFGLRAYDDYGRFLEERYFKLRVTNPKDDYIINDYLPKPAKEFGQIYTLYDLMSDQKLLETIISRIPVSELDSLGVTYGVSKDFVTVNSLEEFKMALANPDIKTISLNDNIDLTSESSPFTIDRSVTIQGSQQLIGDVKLGNGQDIDVRLTDIAIDGNLTVDAGPNGTVILDNVYVNGTPTILSGGVHSIHLNSFVSAEGIVVNNTSQLRIATTNRIPSVDLKGPGAVTLEGEYGTVHVSTSTLLNMTENTNIDTVNVDPERTLIVSGANGIIGETTGKGTIRLRPSAGGLSVDPVLEPSTDMNGRTNIDIVGAPLDSGYTVWAKFGKLAPIDGIMPKDPTKNGYSKVTSGDEELAASVGDYVNFVEVEDATGQIVGFNAFKVQPGDIGIQYASSSDFSASIKFDGGSTVTSGKTKVSYSGLPYQHHLYATDAITSAATAPLKGSTFNFNDKAPTPPYTISVMNGVEISGAAAGKIITIIEVDESNKVVGYKTFELKGTEVGTR